MNREEAIAESYLINVTSKTPEYEPLGESTFPDFEIEDIAIEVRRLNVNYVIEGELHGALNALLAMQNKLSEVMKATQGNPKIGTYAVYVAFKRPIGSMKRLANLARQEMQLAYGPECKKYMEIQVTDNIIFECHLIKYEGCAYVFRGLFDLDYDPNLKNTYRENIQTAIDDKEMKARACEKAYKQFWLILVDEIHCPDIQLIDSLQGTIESDIFEKVVYLNSYRQTVCEFQLSQAAVGTP